MIFAEKLVMAGLEKTNFKFTLLIEEILIAAAILSKN